MWWSTMRKGWVSPFEGGLRSPFGRRAGGAKGFKLPDGVPTPAVWFMPEHTTQDGAGYADVLLNQGTGGAVYDAVPVSANKILIRNEASWAGRLVFDSSVPTSGGYMMGSVLNAAASFMTITTYENGAANFINYDAIVSGPSDGTSSEFELVGNINTPRLLGKTDSVFRDGVKGVPSSFSVLPLLKNTLGGVEATPLHGAQGLFFDNFGTARNWRGLTGHMMLWDVILSDAQMVAVSDALLAHYA